METCESLFYWIAYENTKHKRLILFSSKYSSRIVTVSSSSNAELCKRTSSSGTEICPNVNVASTVFYVMVYAHNSFGSGSLLFTGDNLVSVQEGIVSVEETNVESNQCQSGSILKEIDVIKKSIAETISKTTGIMKPDG